MRARCHDYKKKIFWQHRATLLRDCFGVACGDEASVIAINIDVYDRAYTDSSAVYFYTGYKYT